MLQKVHINLTKTKIMKAKINDAIRTYFKNKSYASVIKIDDEIKGSKCYVKIKITLDYYINDDNFQIIDVDFKNKTFNGFLNLDKAGIDIN